MRMLESFRNLFLDIPLLLYRWTHANIQGDYCPRNALVIVAHPDDPEYFFAGTLARWVQGGTVVRYIICTSGQIGIQDRSLAKGDVAAIREAEQIAAAGVIGVKEVVFLHHQDGLLENSLLLRRQLVREIRIFRPEVVLINDPTIVFGEDFINHPDHRIAATAALDSVFPLAEMPLLFSELEEEGFQPHQVRKVYIQTWQKPNIWINITGTMDLKIAAIQKHASQMGQRDPSAEIRASAAKSAKFTGIKFAETFRVITLISDDAWERSIKTGKY
jgi:LmbE family N-acetylglucosaminyl deacetylase